MIVVKDNFFNTALRNLIAKGAETYKWQYWLAVPDDPTNNKYFVSYLWTDCVRRQSVPHVMETDRERISNHSRAPVLPHNCERQVKGQNGNWHKDHSDKTVLYFPLAGNRDWGGCFTLKLVIQNRR